MILLNLLSPEKQKKRKHREIMRLVTVILEFFVIATSTIAIILLITHFFLQDEMTKIVASTNIIPGLHSLDRKIRTVNRDADRIFSRQQNYQRWTPLLVDIAKKFPQGTHVDSLLLDIKTKKITLTGRAKDRTDLLTLEKTMSTIQGLQNISLPFAALLQKENPAWTLTADLFIDER